jgi:hypothetical protein
MYPTLTVDDQATVIAAVRTSFDRRARGVTAAPIWAATEGAVRQ